MQGIGSWSNRAKLLPLFEDTDRNAKQIAVKQQVIVADADQQRFRRQQITMANNPKNIVVIVLTVLHLNDGHDIVIPGDPGIGGYRRLFFAIHPDSTKIYFIGHFGNFSFLFNFLLVLVLSKIGCLRLSYANREDIILCRRTGWLFSGQAIPEKSLF